MYLAEVLNKLPVMQHFLFGSIIIYDGPLLPDSVPNDAHQGHVHGGTGPGWGDCCGIPVPSSFAAAREAEKKQPGMRLVGPGIRPVPFD
jgi:serine/threonine-protein phosphatase 2A activator